MDATPIIESVIGLVKGAMVESLIVGIGIGIGIAVIAGLIRKRRRGGN